MGKPVRGDLVASRTGALRIYGLRRSAEALAESVVPNLVDSV